MRSVTEIDEVIARIQKEKSKLELAKAFRPEQYAMQRQIDTLNWCAGRPVDDAVIDPEKSINEAMTRSVRRSGAEA